MIKAKLGTVLLDLHSKKESQIDRCDTCTDLPSLQVREIFIDSAFRSKVCRRYMFPSPGSVFDLFAQQISDNLHAKEASKEETEVLNVRRDWEQVFPHPQ